MYVMNVGIIYWASVQDSDVVRGGRQERLAVADTMLVESVTIPGTSYRRKRNYERTSDDSLEARIGQVVHHIVLEKWIVFTTDLNKIYCYPTIFPMPAFNVPEPIELTTFPSSCPSERFQIRDLQGSFIRFAVFTTSGAVLTADKDLLNAFQNAPTSPPPPQPLPSPVLLTSSTSNPIISLAYGDHHYHALHATGTITSYGLEPQRCGALGLGNRLVSPLRGVAVEGGPFGGGRLPTALSPTIWFDPLMQTWLQDMSWAAKEPEAKARGEMLLNGHVGACEAMGRYYEREGAGWEDGVAVTIAESERLRDEESGMGMGAYFVLKVAAAGWHSAALVLVDEDKADAAQRSHHRLPSSSSVSSSSPSSSSADLTDGASVDTQGFAFEAVESPSEQLVLGIRSVGRWIWDAGRWFLGLRARDEIREREASTTTKEGKEEKKEGKKEIEREREREVVYEWRDRPLPRLRMENGEVMPGEIEITE